jgi:hypothetical protein
VQIAKGMYLDAVTKGTYLEIVSEGCTARTYAGEVILAPEETLLCIGFQHFDDQRSRFGGGPVAHFLRLKYKYEIWDLKPAGKDSLRVLIEHSGAVWKIDYDEKDDSYYLLVRPIMTDGTLEEEWGWYDERSSDQPDARNHFANPEEAIAYIEKEPSGC